MLSGEKVKAIRNAKGLTLANFSKPLLVGGSLISMIENGEREATERLVSDILRVYRVSQEWWDTGEGPMFKEIPTLELITKLRGGDPLKLGSEYDVQVKENPFATVKVYDRICCGDGVEPGGREEIGAVSVPVKYDKPHIIMVRARGRSMEPTIKEGGYVGIDTSDREVISGEMYAVCSQLEGAVVKRLVVKGDCLELVAENKVFEPVEVRDVPGYFVIGRVRLVVNEY
jgi:phage repressor protein C with HTH and peptisase S24 domain